MSYQKKPERGYNEMRRISNKAEADIEAMAAYLAGQPDVLAAYLFGSAARGQADQLSDVVS